MAYLLKPGDIFKAMCSSPPKLP